VTSTTPHDTQTHGDDALSFPEYYCAGVQPGNQVDWSRSLEPGASFGKHSRSLPDDGRLTHEPLDTVTSATPYDTQAHNDGALSFPEYYWPATDLHPQYHGPGTASWENPFTSTAAPEASTMVPGPNSGEYFYETSMSRVLTDRGQYRSTTGGTRVGRQLVCSMTWQVSELDHPSTTRLTPLHRTCKRRINTVLVGPGT